MKKPAIRLRTGALRAGHFASFLPCPHRPLARNSRAAARAAPDRPPGGRHRNGSLREHRQGWRDHKARTKAVGAPPRGRAPPSVAGAWRKSDADWLKRALIVAAFALSSPALAEGRHDLLLNCDFAGEKLTLSQNGDLYGLEIAGQTFPASLVQPGPDGRIVAVFAMLDAGPLMIAVATTEGDPVHPSEITASQVGAQGLATRSTKGTCTEATR
ncbi:MAG: hypothetical protein ACKVPY_01340 [Paracoccaceae bacterium]